MDYTRAPMFPKLKLLFSPPSLQVYGAAYATALPVPSAVLFNEQDALGGD